MTPLLLLAFSLGVVIFSLGVVIGGLIEASRCPHRRKRLPQ